MKKLVIALLLIPTLAGANPIILGGDNTFYSWSFPNGVFWNNTSYDRNGQANIGRWLTGTGGSDVPGFYDDSPYLYPNQLGSGSTQFGWVGDLEVTHFQSVTGWNDSFGVYDLVTGERYLMGSAWDATPSGYAYFSNQWGFWLESGEGNTWYSGGPIDGGRSHFALFNSGNTYWLGIEDATWNTRRTADWDYNDVILSWEVQPVPEPIGFGTFIFGLMALVVVKRRLQ